MLRRECEIPEMVVPDVREPRWVGAAEVVMFVIGAAFWLVLAAVELL